MKKPSVRLRKLLLAAYFVLGGTFTFYLGVERVQENKELYAITTVLAIVFDFLFFKTLFSLFGRRAMETVTKRAGKLFSVLFRGIGKLCELVGDAFLPKDRTFVEGKSERSFVFETHGGEGGVKRKLPKLPKNASDREKIRHAYTVYVFKKDKNISGALTPSEVARRLDAPREDAPVFERYNDARYTE